MIDECMGTGKNTWKHEGRLSPKHIVHPLATEKSCESVEYGCYIGDKYHTYNDIASPICLSVPEHVSSASSYYILMEGKGKGKGKLERTRLIKSQWTTFLGIYTVTILLAGCLRRGLFYSTDLSPVILMTGVVVSIIFIMSVRGKTGTEPVALRQSDPTWFGVLISAHIVFPLLIMICYAVHAWVGSVSTQGSIHEMLRWSLIAMFALLATQLAKSKGGVSWLALGWQLAGGVLVFSGIMAVCGVLPLPYGVMRTADPEISSAGARLGGLLQYPNAYGAVVGMYALERLTAAAGVLAAGRAVPASRVFAAVLPLMPAQAALLLSESRGALLAAGCAAAAAFALQRRGARLPLLLALAAPLACAAWLYRQLAAAQLAPAPVPGLLALAGAWAAALLGTLLLCRLWHSGARAGRAAALAATVLACIAAALMAAASTAERFAAGVGTGTSRLHMWRDALKLWTEAAWLGHGGDTWRSMFRAIQSSPYVGGEVHSGPLDLALDTGLLGIALIAGWMIFTLRSIRRFAPRLLPPVLVLVLHGTVDFDWSYTLSWMLFIWLAAWAVALRTEAETVSSHPFIHRHDASGGRPPRHYSYPFSSSLAMILSGRAQVCTDDIHDIHMTFSRFISGPIKRYTITLLFACWLGGTIWITALHTWADIQYRQALVELKSNVRHEHLKLAYRLNPTRPELALALARMLPQPEAKSILLSSLSHSVSEPELYLELGRISAQSGEGFQAGKHFMTAISLNRYDYGTQWAALYWMEQAVKREIKEGKVRQAQQTAIVGTNMYEQYKNLAAEVIAERMRNDRRFLLHNSASLTGEKLRKVATGAL